MGGPRSQSQSKINDLKQIVQHNGRDLEKVPELVAGHWTNITLHSLNKLDSNLRALATSNEVSFFSKCASQESLFSTNTGLPMRQGSRKIIKKLG